MVLALGLVWLALAGLAATFQRQLIYLPDRRAPESPADVEVVSFRTADGLDLQAWYLAPSPPPGVPDSGVTVLAAPGNAGNRAARLPLARGLADRGHGVLLLDYRGYGGNPGRPSEAGLREDALAAHAALARRPDVDDERIALYGASLGTGVVAAIASEAEPIAVVLRSPFPELADVARTALPWLPVRTLLRDRYPVVVDLRDVEAPVLVVLGDRDGVVAPALSRAVAASLEATLVEVPGADHNDLALLAGRELLDAVDRFLRETS